ncbi:unnamed protein product [Nezara viridula]|uniref:Aquaporin n=1 Tax=Nezara viridula TaxID=85310 RepID=A0A9P0MPF2_NEZVI|nr:unnamed protein product [Nezara viridula]
MGALFGLTVSTGYIILSCLIAWWARKLADKVWPKSTIAKCLFLEGIATWELCSTCFELIIVADNYGVLTYGLYLFLLTIWWSQVWGDSSACPYTHIEEIVEGGQGPAVVVAKILAELAGGALTFRYAQYLWSLEVTINHRGRAYEACTADLQVPALIGAVIEGLATCLCRIVSRAISEVGVPYGYVADSFFGTAMVLAAFNYSGGYFNPALATGLKLGCAGHTTTQFGLVYWVGPIVGAVASVFLYRGPFVQGLVKKMSRKQD